MINKNRTINSQALSIFLFFSVLYKIFKYFLFQATNQRKGAVPDRHCPQNCEKQFCGVFVFKQSLFAGLFFTL